MGYFLLETWMKNVLGNMDISIVDVLLFDDGRHVLGLKGECGDGVNVLDDITHGDLSDKSLKVSFSKPGVVVVYYVPIVASGHWLLKKL